MPSFAVPGNVDTTLLSRRVVPFNCPCEHDNRPSRASSCQRAIGAWVNEIGPGDGIERAAAV
jgi:hypothetical protein